MADRKTKIMIGTSGYSFDDWRGTFYPEDIEKGKMFDHYLKHFPCVEINATYYRIPHPAVMSNIEKKSPPGYEFIVKTPGTVTHKRKDIKPEIDEYKECLKPMAEAGKLEGLLAQFPYSFKFNHNNLEYIKTIREMLKEHPLYVEFRHDSWVNRKMYDTFREYDIGYVSVDEPNLKYLPNPDLFATTDIGYIRLHGRNAEKWWDGGPLRYDYDYSEEELTEWKNKIEKFDGKTKKLFIFFNNCHLGQAVKNARELSQALDL